MGRATPSNRCVSPRRNSDTAVTASEFSSAARELNNSYQNVVKDANTSIREIRTSINRASEAAANAATTLNRNFHRDYKWAVYSLCMIALSLGFILGDLFHWWISSPMGTSTPSAPIVQTAPPPPTNTKQPKPQRQNRPHAPTAITKPFEPLEQKQEQTQVREQ